MRAWLALAVALTSASSFAASTRYGWLFDTQTLPERTVEVTMWIFEQNGQPATNDTTTLWWAPALGITDRIEVLIPVQMSFEQTTSGLNATLDHFGLEGRFKLTNPDPVEAGPIGVVTRVAVSRLTGDRGSVQIEGGVITSVGVGRFHAVLDAEALAQVGNRPAHFELQPGLGFSVRVVEQFRLGAEAVVNIELGDSSGRWVGVGPNAAWVFGRFWISGSFLIGAVGIRTAPKVNFGIVF